MVLPEQERRMKSREGVEGRYTFLLTHSWSQPKWRFFREDFPDPDTSPQSGLSESGLLWSLKRGLEIALQAMQEKNQPSFWVGPGKPNLPL